MNKSSTLKGLLNEQPKNIAEYLATWDDLNVFWKSLNQAWNLIAGLWSTKNELEQEDKEAYIKTVNVYMKEKNISKFSLHTIFYSQLNDLFDVQCFKVSSQKELDDYFLELEKK